MVFFQVSLTCHVLIEQHNTLIAGMSTGAIIIWKSKKTYSQTALVQLRLLSGHKGRIYCLRCAEIAPNVELLFSGSADRTIRVWDPFVPDADRAGIQSLIGHNGTITSIEFSQGTLLTASTDKTLRVWRRDDARGVALYPFFVCLQVVSDFGDWVLAVFVKLGDPTTIFLGDGRGVVSTYSATSSGRLKALRRQTIHDRGISDIIVVPQENFVVTLSFDFTVQVHDAVNGTGFFAVENPNRCRYTGVAWDVKRQELNLVDAMGYLQIWNVFLEKCLKVQRLRRGELHQITLHGSDLLVVGAPECIEVWRVQREVHSKECTGHSGAIVGMVYDHDRILCSASLDNTVRCWNGAMVCIAVLKEEESEISSFSQVPESNLLFTGLDNGQIHLWNVDTGSVLVMKAHTNTVSTLAIAVTRRRDFLISSGYDGRVLVWDISKRKTINPCVERELHRGTSRTSEIIVVAYNPSSGAIFAGGNDNLIHIWDLDSYEPRGTLIGHTNAVTCLAFDANIVFSGSEDRTIRIWDGFYRQCLWVFEEHVDVVRDLVFISECGSLVSCSFDGEILIWDYVKQAVQKRFTHRDQPRCLLLDPVARQVCIGSEQGGITIFPLPEWIYEEQAEIDLNLQPLDILKTDSDAIRLI